MNYKAPDSNNNVRFWVAAILLLGLAACATRRDSAPSTPLPPGQIREVVPKAEPRSAGGNPPFYEVFGKRYHVLDDGDGYTARGVASWYGEKFHGRPTASGEPYDMYAASAAHKTLPLPSYVRVTNLENGRSVIVRINDRGPFVANRLIDLSFGAARQLDMIRNGTSFVEVQVVTADSVRNKPASSIERSGELAESLFVQVGAFGEYGNATRLRALLNDSGIEDVVIREQRLHDRKLFRVRIGPVTSVTEFDETIARVVDLGISDAHLAIE